MTGARIPFTVVVLGVLIAVAGLGLALRFSVMEAPAIGWLCQSAEAPWYCGARQALVVLFRSGGLGIIAAALGLAALLVGGRRLVLVAVAVGTVGSVLYNVDLSAAGVLMASLRAVRL